MHETDIAAANLALSQNFLKDQNSITDIISQLHFPVWTTSRMCSYQKKSILQSLQAVNDHIKV